MYVLLRVCRVCFATHTLYADISPEMGEQMGLSKMEIARRDEAMRAKKQKLK
jgi:hypothetical protein